MATAAEIQADIARVTARKDDPNVQAYFAKNYGGIDSYLASQNQRLQQAIANETAKSSSSSSGGSVTVTNTPFASGSGQVYQSPSPPPPSQSQGFTPEQLRQIMREYSFPYEQAIRDLIGSAPQYTMPSEEDLTQQARQWAELQINPQISALRRAAEQAQQALETRQQQVGASYAGVEDTVNRVMQQAAQKALESAISRGGGQSGAVEWLTNQLQQPITERFTQAQAQKAAELADIASRVSLLQEQYGMQEQELQAQLGQLEANRLAELRNLAQAQAQGNWQQVLQSTQNLANMATQAQQFAAQMALSTLPYYTMTEWQRQTLPTEWANLMGEVPQTGSNYSSANFVPLRAYASERGASIDYDPTTGNVIIDGKAYNSDILQSMGGVLQDGRWYLPESAANKLIRGY